jgi:hypothetical protein
MKGHTSEELGSAMAELEEQTDRGAAIIAAALLEHHLGEAIRTRLTPLNSAMRDNLFGSRGSLGGFQAKIDMGFALGLYTKDAHHDLDSIRKIRNRFAHTPVALDFHDREIEKLALSLMQHGMADRQDPRDRFMVTYLGLAVLLYAMSKGNIQLRPLAETHPTIADEVSAAVFGTSPKTP